MREYLMAIWSQLRALIAAICGKPQTRKEEVRSPSESAYAMTNAELADVHVLLTSKLEFDCVRAYFRLIAAIMRYKRWMKPGKPISQEFRRALELFVAVEWQFAECGFRPLLPVHRMYEVSDEPTEVVKAGYVVRRGQDEEPVFYARAVLRQVEKLSASKAMACSVA